MSQYTQVIPGEDQNGHGLAEMMSAREKKRAYRQAMWKLASNLQGELILPGDADYEAARGTWNAAYDRRPAAIARCSTVEDVIAAVHFAREQGLEVAVRSGGHSIAGYSSSEGGLVIDLSEMKALAVDTEQCIMRLEPGLTWKEVADALQPYGLALTAGDTGTVGVGGLMLGGGIGWMVRKYGLAIDNLRAVELVTADGELLRASEDENSELFWGLRGGGGNFGVVTAFEVDLHPGGVVLGGAVFYEATHAERILQSYTHLAAEAPDELSTQALLVVAPPLPFIPLF